MSTKPRTSQLKHVRPLPPPRSVETGTRAPRWPPRLGKATGSRLGGCWAPGACSLLPHPAAAPPSPLQVVAHKELSVVMEISDCLAGGRGPGGSWEGLKAAPGVWRVGSALDPYPLGAPKMFEG